MGGTIAIGIIIVLFVGTVAFIELRDEIRSKKYQLDPTEGIKREIQKKIRYEYRTCIPGLKINGKRR